MLVSGLLSVVIYNSWRGHYWLLSELKTGSMFVLVDLKQNKKIQVKFSDDNISFVLW